MGGFASGYTAVTNAQNERDKLREVAKQRNEDLAIKGYSFDENGNNMGIRQNSEADVAQQQALQASQLAKAVQNKLDAQASDNALADYAADGNADRLNYVMQNTPGLKKSWGERGVQMVGNIDFNKDTTLLNNNGFQPSQYDTPEKQAAISKNIFKKYDGKDWSLGLANQVAAETGAYKRAGPRVMGQVEQNHQDLIDLMSGPKVDPYTAEGHKYEKSINSAAEETGLPPNLIASLIHQENPKLNNNAVSSAGAGGLTQLMPNTAKSVGVTDVTDSDQAIHGGARYLKQMLDKYQGDLPKALAAYNAGPTAVNKYNGIPPYGETQNYVQKVLSNFHQAESHYGRTAQGSGDAIAQQYASADTGQVDDSGKPIDRNQQTIDTILNSQRDQAAAAKGTSAADIHQSTVNETTTNDLKAQELQIKADEVGVENKKADAAIAAANADKTTTDQKNLKASEERIQQLQDKFGGPDQFNKTDFSDPKNYTKAYSDVAAIEKLTGTQLGEADKKNIANLRSLITLGNVATDLSDDKTGLLDSRLANVKQYLSNNTSGIAARSAYSAFSNILLHAFGGSNMTPAEIERFMSAYGALGQQKGPVLEQFKTAVIQLQSQLDTAASTMDPRVAKVRLGADQAKVKDIITRLDKSIDWMNGMKDGVPATGSSPNIEQPKTKQPLDEIFR